MQAYEEMKAYAGDLAARRRELEERLAGLGRKLEEARAVFQEAVLANAETGKPRQALSRVTQELARGREEAAALGRAGAGREQLARLAGRVVEQARQDMSELDQDWAGQDARLAEAKDNLLCLVREMGRTYRAAHQLQEKVQEAAQYLPSPQPFVPFQGDAHPLAAGAGRLAGSFLTPRELGEAFAG
ncbi:MAG: hypothetical protein KQJ78_09935 [Deltaproteobacteria bacterium]|nr:hypothetical protein [Deltaproteobacteria bacterium]